MRGVYPVAYRRASRGIQPALRPVSRPAKPHSRTRAVQRHVGRRSPAYRHWRRFDDQFTAAERLAREYKLRELIQFSKLHWIYRNLGPGLILGEPDFVRPGGGWILRRHCPQSKYDHMTFTISESTVESCLVLQASSLPKNDPVNTDVAGKTHLSITNAYSIAGSPRHDFGYNYSRPVADNTPGQFFRSGQMNIYREAFSAGLFQLSGPRFALAGGFATPRPPPDVPAGKNHKEKKLKGALATVYLAISRGVGSFTEGMDFIEALYQAIPAKYRRWRGRDGKWRDRAHGPYEKAKHIYRYLPFIEVDKAIKNLIYNELQDRAIGKLSRPTQRGRGGPGQPSQAAPDDERRRVEELYLRARQERNKKIYELIWE